MTTSTLLPAEAVSRLADIQRVSSLVSTAAAKRAFADDLARETINVVKRPL